MKKQKLILTLIFTIISCANAIEKDLERSLESRPCYQKNIPDIDPHLNSELIYHEYSDYFIDSTYVCERENFTLIALVRANKIVGFEVVLMNLDYLSSQDIEPVVKRIYESEGFTLVNEKSIGINDNEYQVYAFIDAEAYKLAKKKALEDLSKALKP